MKAIVNVPICTLYREPTRESTCEDEALYGMVVDVLAEVEPGWYRIRTHYGYEGIVSAEELLTDSETVTIWSAMANHMVLNKQFCDILSEPKVQGWRKMSLPLGARIRVLQELETGWMEVALADGRTGFVQGSILTELPRGAVSQDEETLRRILVESVLRYRGTHYRWGGKSPMGVDCSGLCSMAYMLSGILIYRDAKLMEGYPIHEIKLEDAKPGDLLYFPGHIAMYLGDGKFCHSTGKRGCDGVVINSLNPEDEDFREDLKRDLIQVGSWFS